MAMAAMPAVPWPTRKMRVMRPARIPLMMDEGMELSGRLV